MQVEDPEGHRRLIQIQAFASSLLRRYKDEKKKKKKTQKADEMEQSSNCHRGMVNKLSQLEWEIPN